MIRQTAVISSVACQNEIHLADYMEIIFYCTSLLFQSSVAIANSPIGLDWHCNCKQYLWWGRSCSKANKKLLYFGVAGFMFKCKDLFYSFITIQDLLKNILLIQVALTVHKLMNSFDLFKPVICLSI